MDQFFYPKDQAKLDFSNNILILPSLTIGNIGQLCIDLLLYNNPQFSKVGSIVSPFTAPLAGNNALYNPSAKSKDHSAELSQVTLGIELFQDASRNITILQQRSPAFHHHSKRYATQLAEWIHQQKFKEVFLLCSTDSARRGDILLSMPQPTLFQFDSVESQLKEAAIQMGFQPATNVKEIFQASSVSFFLREALNSHKVPIFALVCYCSEGFNSLEAFQTAAIVNQLVLGGSTDQNPNNHNNNNLTQWTEPPAWQYLHGRDHQEYNLF